MLDLREHRQWERWERIGIGGRKRFVWLYGVCGWGLSFGCLATIILAIDLVSRRHPVPVIAVLPLLLGPVGGFILGSIMWDQTETKYLAARAAARKNQE